jgi:hypothetical protein
MYVCIYTSQKRGVWKLINFHGQKIIYTSCTLEHHPPPPPPPITTRKFLTVTVNEQVPPPYPPPSLSLSLTGPYIFLCRRLRHLLHRFCILKAEHATALSSSIRVSEPGEDVESLALPAFLFFIHLPSETDGRRGTEGVEGGGPGKTKRGERERERELATGRGMINTSARVVCRQTTRERLQTDRQTFT